MDSARTGWSLLPGSDTLSFAIFRFLRADGLLCSLSRKLIYWCFEVYKQKSLRGEQALTLSTPTSISTKVSSVMLQVMGDDEQTYRAYKRFRPRHEIPT